MLLEMLDLKAIRPDKMYAVKEVAYMFGVSDMTVWRLIKRGELPAYQISKGTIRITGTAIRAFLSARKVRQTLGRKKKVVSSRSPRPRRSS